MQRIHSNTYNAGKGFGIVYFGHCALVIQTKHN